MAGYIGCKMRTVHYYDEKTGGGEIVLPAPETDITAFQQFLVKQLGLPIKKLPKIANKSLGCRIESWIFPPARGTNRLLVVAPLEYPCNLCHFAEYNHICQHQKYCAPFTYWSLVSLDTPQNNLRKTLEKNYRKMQRRKNGTHKQTRRKRAPSHQSRKSGGGRRSQEKRG